MITTTLNRIREHSPCASGWRKLLAHLGKTEADDEVLPYAVIVEACGMSDALWCCRVEPQHSKEWRLFAVSCARSVQHLMKDPRSLVALDVAERHANGLATDAELAAAGANAWSAAGANAWSAAGANAWSAAGANAGSNAGDAAWSAAWPAAWDAAGDAAKSAAQANARANAEDAAWSAAWSAFKADFLQVVGETA
jgi:hypothetical protein